MNEKRTEAPQAAPRQGWRKDGTVDVDAVRAGTPDLADAPALYESLCDEVESLRTRFREVAALPARPGDSNSGDWGFGYDSGYNSALAAVSSILMGGVSR